MTFPELKAELRPNKGKAAAGKLRAKGRIPAVFYGPGVEPVSLTIDPGALKKIILSSPARSFLLNLKIAGQDHAAMLKDFQVHPVNRAILHADFMRVEADKAVTMEVPLEFFGEPAGLSRGGILEQHLRFVALSGLPGRLPEKIRVDVSSLNIGDSLKVSDLSLPEGVEIKAEAGAVVCTLMAPAGEEAARPAAEAEAAEGKGEGPESA